MTPEGFASVYHIFLESRITEEPNTRNGIRLWSELSPNMRLRLTKAAEKFLEKYDVRPRGESAPEPAGEANEPGGGEEC
jgi:hypothetical protein